VGKSDRLLTLVTNTPISVGGQNPIRHVLVQQPDLDTGLFRNCVSSFIKNRMICSEKVDVCESADCATQATTCMSSIEVVSDLQWHYPAAHRHAAGQVTSLAMAT